MPTHARHARLVRLPLAAALLAVAGFGGALTGPAPTLAQGGLPRGG